MKHNDGIIKFHEKRHGPGICPNCSELTLVWQIKDVKLPEGIKPSAKLIVYTHSNHDPGYETLKQIGIGCGCYSKFHRQIAHIKDRLQKG